MASWASSQLTSWQLDPRKITPRQEIEAADFLRLSLESCKASFFLLCPIDQNKSLASLDSQVMKITSTCV